MADNVNIIDSIEELNLKVITLANNINFISGALVPGIIFSEYGEQAKGVMNILTKKVEFPSNRQIAKKLLMIGGNVGLQEISQIDIVGDLGTNDLLGMKTYMDEETAHFVIYGKPMMYVDGKLIDDERRNPECVGPDPGQDSRIKTLTDNSAILDNIKQMKKEVMDAISTFSIKLGEIGPAAKDIIPQLTIAGIALASAVTILPFGAGLPSAVSAVKNLLAAIMALQTRITQLIQMLYPLKYLTLLLNPVHPIKPDPYTEAMFVVNSLFSAITIPLDAINGLIGTITAIFNLVPKIPGQDPDTPPEGVEADLKATSENIKRGEETTIEVNAINGSWNYNYYWSSIPSGFISNLKIVKVKPYSDTKYYCRVSDKKDPGNKITKNIKIYVS